MYFINYDTYDECFKIPVVELRTICKEHGRKISGGDNNRSRMYLISREHYMKYLIKPLKGSSHNIEVRSSIAPDEQPLPIVCYTNSQQSYTEQLITYLEKCDIKDMEHVKRCIGGFRREYAQKRLDDENAKQPTKAYKENPNELQFGKYKGRLIQDIAGTDKKYVQWLIKQDWFKENTPLFNVALSAISITQSSKIILSELVAWNSSSR